MKKNLKISVKLLKHLLTNGASPSECAKFFDVTKQAINYTMNVNGIDWRKIRDAFIHKITKQYQTKDAKTKSKKVR